MVEGATATRRRRQAGSMLPALVIGWSVALLPVQSAQAGEGWRAFRPEGPPVLGVREPPRLAATAGVSVDRVIAEVERRYKARVVDHKEVEVNGRRVIVLRLYSEKDGRVWTVRIDAETGREV
jgi:uncharacterized membrane protein YkoI